MNKYRSVNRCQVSAAGQLASLRLKVRVWLPKSSRTCSPMGTFSSSAKHPAFNRDNKLPVDVTRRQTQARISPIGWLLRCHRGLGHVCHRRVHSSPARVKDTYDSTTHSDNITYISIVPCAGRRGGEAGDLVVVTLTPELVFDTAEFCRVHAICIWQ